MNEFLNNFALFIAEASIIAMFVAIIYIAWRIIPKRYRNKITNWVNEMYSRVNE